MSEPSYKTLLERAQFLNLLGRDLERISSQQSQSRVVRYVLRKLGEVLQADLLIQLDVRRADGAFERPFTLALTTRGRKMPEGTKHQFSDSDPMGESFLKMAREFVKRPVNPADPEVLLLRVLSEDRPAALFGFLRPGRRFSTAETRFGQDAAEILSENLRHRERERAQDLRERIYAKIIAERRPQDVLYQILHGLRRLLQYDHGAGVLLLSPDEGALTVRAEIIAWTKAKSDRIGQQVLVTPDLRQWLEHPSKPVLLRAGDRAEALADVPAGLHAPLIETAPGVPAVRGMILAVLHHRHRPLGVLEIRSRSAGAFSPGDLRTLDEFLPLASVTLYNSTLYKIQYDKLVTAERETALATLARAISHDLNNAFGVMLPLLQTLRRDVAAGMIELSGLAQDLGVIERYANSSSRIFQGLLSMAQGTVEPARWGSVNSILENLMRMIGPTLESKGIKVSRELAQDAPRIFFRRGEMEQIFLNLIYNARDAMADGGRLTLRSSPEGGGVLIEVLDTGTGISEEIRGRIFEPFFTTKETGSGLGLDITRSLVWDYDGRLDLDSLPGRGTRAAVWLPQLAERLRAEETASLEENHSDPLPRTLSPERENKHAE
jgi:two-component system, NtrC family, sensor kinase